MILRKPLATPFHPLSCQPSLSDTSHPTPKNQIKSRTASQVSKTSNPTTTNSAQPPPLLQLPQTKRRKHPPPPQKANYIHTTNTKHTQNTTPQQKQNQELLPKSPPKNPHLHPLSHSLSNLKPNSDHEPGSERRLPARGDRGGGLRLAGRRRCCCWGLSRGAWGVHGLRKLVGV